MPIPSLREIFFCREPDFFYDEAKKELLDRDGSKLIRPVALMLQNGWISQKLDTLKSEPLFSKTFFHLTSKASSYFTFSALLKRFIWDLKQVVRKSSLKKEVAWLQSRLRN